MHSRFTSRLVPLTVFSRGKHEGGAGEGVRGEPLVQGLLSGGDVWDVCLTKFWELRRFLS